MGFLFSTFAFDDGASNPCCVGTFDTCSDSDGASTGAGLVGHQEGVSGGRGLEALILPV